MGRFSGVLLATDMDGTLLRRDGTLSPGNRAAIEEFIREGGFFTVATGRSALGFEKLRPAVPFNAPCILSNGAVIYDYTENRALLTETLQGDPAAVVRGMLAQYPGIGVEFHQIRRKFVLNRNRFIDGHFLHVGCTGADISAPEEAEPPFVKIMFVDHPKLLTEAADTFRRAYGAQYQMQFSCPYMAEFQNHGTNKGQGAAALAKHLGIAEKRVFTAGDEQNDLPMLRRFCSFAPANATDEAKAAAKHPLPDCDEDAIAALIARIESLENSD